jgi:hypothetical protein
MTDRLRVPTHVLALLSASTAAYAVLLAGVAGAQSGGEAALIANRQPVQVGVESLSAAHDALAAQLDRARLAYADAANAYTAAGGGLDALEASLTGLASTVSDINGVATSLPTTVKLPPVRTITKVSVPATHTTTGASGVVK